MRPYWSILKGQYRSITVYRYGRFFTLVGNLSYIVVIYFLWRQIYHQNTKMHGMTFNQVLVYLTLASSLFGLFKTWTDWFISRQILDGSIAIRLIRPLDYQWQMLAGSLASVAFNGLMITIPSMAVVLLVMRASIPLGINLLFVLPSITCAFLLSFALDYITGLTSFYTESLWGISTTKEVVVSLLAGALIPLQFFPDSAQRVLQVLPFQAIYYTPLQLCTAPGLSLVDCVRMLSTQLVWVAVFIAGSRLFYRQAIKVLTVNGG